MAAYKRETVQTPKLKGVPLKLFAESLETPLGDAIVAKLTRDSGIDRFRATPTSASPLQHPLVNSAPVPVGPNEPRAIADAVLANPATLPGPFQPESAAHFAAAYRAGKTSPVEVAHKVIDAIARLGGREDGLATFIASSADDIRAQAEASEKRIRAGKPLSLLDGVPVAVKDEMDQVPYPTTVGTRFLGTHPAGADAAVVAKLRAAGALLIGKANMHEVGINPIGINPHHGAARNPYDRGRITGGSSSGSAAAVAAGLCPIAVGADGGGSIRIPASLCGVVGLKATFGRNSERGVYPLCWTVGHVGPIGATVRDVAAAYVLMAGADPHDVDTLGQPPAHLDGLEKADLSGIRIGIHRPYFEDADPDVVRSCEAGVKALVQAGATVVDVPPPDSNTILWSHAVIILSEMVSCLAPHIREDVRRFGLDVRINLAIGRRFTSADYVHALRHRHQLTAEYTELMKNVDVIVTPTTASVAPPMPENALPDGQSDLRTTDALMRFVRVGNLTGFPALSVPTGYGAGGLPVGLQLLGRPWEEHLLMRLGLVVERAVERRRPAHYVRLLE